MSFLYQCLHQLRELQGDLDPAESTPAASLAGVPPVNGAADLAGLTPSVPRADPPLPPDFDLGTLGMHLGCDG